LAAHCCCSCALGCHGGGILISLLLLPLSYPSVFLACGERRCPGVRRVIGVRRCVCGSSQALCLPVQTSVSTCKNRVVFSSV
jgi:hypothetical protein